MELVAHFGYITVNSADSGDHLRFVFQLCKIIRRQEQIVILLPLIVRPAIESFGEYCPETLFAAFIQLGSRIGSSNGKLGVGKGEGGGKGFLLSLVPEWRR